MPIYAVQDSDWPMDSTSQEAPPWVGHADTPQDAAIKAALTWDSEGDKFDGVCCAVHEVKMVAVIGAERQETGGPLVWDKAPTHTGQEVLKPTFVGTLQQLLAGLNRIAGDETESATVRAIISAAQREITRLHEALTPSGHTKAAYIGEFQFNFPTLDENGNEVMRTPNVPWTTIKEIMDHIRVRADATQGKEHADG